MIIDAYIPSDTSAQDFLDRNGVMVSVRNIIGARSKGVLGICTNDHSSICWIARRVVLQLKQGWHDPKEPEEYKELQGKIDALSRLPGSHNGEPIVSGLIGVTALLETLRYFVIKYAEFFCQQIAHLRIHQENNCENNTDFLSNKLRECVLIGVRLGISGKLIERWSHQLDEIDAHKLREQICPVEAPVS